MNKQEQAIDLVRSGNNTFITGVAILFTAEDYVDISYYKNNYKVYKDGSIYSYQKKNYLSKLDNGKGYLKVNLFGDNKSKQVYIHRLVAFCFLPNPHNLPEVNHKDADKQNNHRDNLEWCDRGYNMKHASINNCFENLNKKRVDNQESWIGEKYGTKTVVNTTDRKNKTGNYYVVTECDCGHISETVYNDLKKRPPNGCKKCRYKRKP